MRESNGATSTPKEVESDSLEETRHRRGVATSSEDNEGLRPAV